MFSAPNYWDYSWWIIVIDAFFQNRTSTQREFDLKSQLYFYTKIALHQEANNHSNTSFFNPHKYFVDPIKKFAKVVSQIL